MLNSNWVHINTYRRREVVVLIYFSIKQVCVYACVYCPVSGYAYTCSLIYIKIVIYISGVSFVCLYILFYFTCTSMFIK